MAKFMKHVGVDTVGNKIVIIFREIPDDPSNCLIVRSNALSEMYHDQLMRVLESDDAQQTVNLYEVLQRRIFGDGQNMLNALHSRGLLIKMPVSSIRVSPMPNRFEELSVVNAAIRGDSTPVSPVAAAVAAVAAFLADEYCRPPEASAGDSSVEGRCCERLW